MNDYAPHIERAFAETPPEESYCVSRVEGEIPPFVRGCYYLNGPARFARGEMRYRHWLDGDGMICALRFEGGRIAVIRDYVHVDYLLRACEITAP